MQEGNNPKMISNDEMINLLQQELKNMEKIIYDGGIPKEAVIKYCWLGNSIDALRNNETTPEAVLLERLSS